MVDPLMTSRDQRRDPVWLAWYIPDMVCIEKLAMYLQHWTNIIYREGNELSPVYLVNWTNSNFLGGIWPFLGDIDC